MKRITMEWIRLFNFINNERIKRGEGAVPFSDVGYYAGQIHGFTGKVDYESAKQTAQEMAAIENGIDQALSKLEDDLKKRRQ